MQDELNTQEDVLRKIAEVNRADPYVDVTPYELGIGFPIVRYPGFFTQPDECIIFAAPAQTFKDKNQVVGYTGRSGGASFRVAKGVTIRTGSSGGRPIRGTVRDRSFGDLIITNKRVSFIGKDDSFEYPMDKLSAIKILDRQSFVLQSGRASKNVAMDEVVVAYAASFITYVQKAIAEGKDVFQEHQVTLTEAQLAHCEEVRMQSETVRLPKQQGRTGCLWTIVKVLLGFLVLVLVISVIAGIGMVIKQKGTDPAGGEEGTVTALTAEELVLAEGHPRIFDSYAEAEAFYTSLGDSRVAVTDAAGKASKERSLESVFDDDVVLYLVRDSSSKEYIGTIEVNIFDPEFASNMSVEQATDIVEAYLPIDFFDYYGTDSSYQYESDGTRVYTYSCRLNDAGVAYHDSAAPQYSYYYNFKIYEYADGEHWKIQTGYGAYGDKDLGWIEKYAEPWDVQVGIN